MAFSTKKVGPAQKPVPKGKVKPIPTGNDPSGQGGKKGGYPGSMPCAPGKSTKKAK
ncbi:MAG: hypothetical protein JHC33_10830 [Ignisphaera sp.]|nr:hypothetical protein [Ignisphaera sp.]